MMKTNMPNIEVKVLNHDVLRQKDFAVFDIYDFLLYQQGRPVSTLRIHQVQKYFSDFVFSERYYDFSYKPPKPMPHVNGMHTDEEFRGNGLAGLLILSANQYFQKTQSISLWSGFSYNRDSFKVWKKLENEGLAERLKVKGYIRWKMK